MILQSGDWLTPKAAPREHVAFLEKPPLKFWIVAAPIRLGLLPDNEFGLRFWDAVFGSLPFLYVFAIGRRLGGPVCGLAAVLILFAHRPLLFEHGLRANTMDAAVVLSYCAGVYHFLAWRASERASRRRLHVVAVALAFVLGFMTKFVAALFLPLVLAAATLLTRDDRARLRRDWRAWCAASLLAAALIAPWFLYQYHRAGLDLWNDMFRTHVYTRFTAYLDPAHLHVWHYYFSELVNQLHAPQALAITMAGLALVLLRTVHSGWPEGALILLWGGLPLSLMSLGTSKLYHYAYPFLPPVALAAGYAAAVLFGVAWSLLAPVQRVDHVLGQAAPRLMRFPAIRVLLLAVAVAAIGVAVATYARGHVRLAVGDVVLVRSSSLFRPSLIALVALALAGRLGTAVRVGAAFVVLLTLPLAAYRQDLSLLSVERHPLRTVRECLQPICARHGGPDPRGPGVWAEAESIAHTYWYYLRSLGPYQLRYFGSDPTVYMHLHVPSKLRPVLLSYARYDEFTRRVRAGDRTVIERAARKAGVDPSALAASANQVDVPLLRLPDGVLMLPGPYAACAAEQGRNALR
jgi:4-amino-4-deoxy-L-arabinose transferase-like glycosyltransferase